MDFETFWNLKGIRVTRQLKVSIKRLTTMFPWRAGKCLIKKSSTALQISPAHPQQVLHGRNKQCSTAQQKNPARPIKKVRHTRDKVRHGRRSLLVRATI